MTVTASSSITAVRLEEIKALLDTTVFKNADLHPLAGDASFRRYIRVRKSGHTAMLMDAPPEKEDVRPFLAIAQYLYGQGYSAPSVLASNVPAGLLLLEDFGDDSFTNVLKRDSTLQPQLYSAAIDVLVQWQDSKRERTLTLPSYSQDLLMKEVSLFSDWFLPQIMEPEKATQLENEYKSLWQDILLKASLSQNVFVHRDYHADNLMWLHGREDIKCIGLLDFQDGVYGDPAYDLVSLLEDARRDVPPLLVTQMLEHYILTSGVDREKFLLAYAVLGAQRNSKIIGIFTRLAVRDHKLHYLNYLPRVWRHLEHDLAHPLLCPLKSWIDQYVLPANRDVITVSKHAHAS
jgi:aminoglycoside/choline kinase family phosphotransferase